jgi:hypothetical protein
MQPTQHSEAPHAPAVQGTPEEGNIEQVAEGQKLIINGLLLYFATTVMIRVVGPIAGLLALVAAVLGFMGVMRLGKGLGMSTGMRVFLGLLMFVPVVSLVALLVLNSRATTRLRAAGYQVGFFGASK